MFLQNTGQLPVINIGSDKDIQALRGAVNNGWHIYKSYKFLVVLLIVFAFSIVSFFATSTFLMEKNYVINELQDNIYSAKAESKAIQIDLSQENSLQNILETSASSLYSEMGYINYVERSTNSPFAFTNNQNKSN